METVSASQAAIIAQIRVPDGDAPDEGFSIYGNRVVSWHDPYVTIDDLIYLWPEHARGVRQLFER